MTRTEFQQLAVLRIEEAEALLAAGKWSGEYYLAGYAVECVLKACIAKRMRAEEFPPKRKFVDDCYSHDLNTLLRTANLERQRDAEAGTNPQFQMYWAVVVKWNEQARYEPKLKADAEALYEAIADPTNGVLKWVRQYW